MWKRDERHEDLAAQRPATPVTPAPEAWSAPASAERATIGRSITLHGDVTGDEDLLIQGHVEGSVNLRQHAVTVGSEGEVVASIVGRVVTVEGRVEGDINGTEQVILRSSAFVKGDIRAPRVVLENGARFRGLVDMGEGDEDQAPSSHSAPAARRTADSGTSGFGTAGLHGSGIEVESEPAGPDIPDARGGAPGSTESPTGARSGKAKWQGDGEPQIPA